MAYIGWATNVNKIILDSTDVNVGEGATVQDSLETGGQKKSRLVCANPPDKFSVTMTFNFTDESKDANGDTELDRFWKWYKWEHRYGVNPFKFPAILLNTNRQQGWATEERGYIANRTNNTEHPEIPLTPDDVPDYEYYKITSAANGTKSGNDCQVTMTWETYATGVISVPAETAEPYQIEAENGYVDVIFTSTPSTEPTDASYTLYIDNVATTVSKFYFDGDVTLRLFFTPLATTGVHTAKVLTFTDDFEV